MKRRIRFAAVLAPLLLLTVWAPAQTLDGRPFTPGVDADIDLYIRSWKESMPQKTHGALVERDILTKGDPLDPPRPGAVLKYVDAFTHATLGPLERTQPVTLDGEQEIFFVYEGRGTVTAGGDTADLYPGIAVLMPAGLEFVMTNTADTSLRMYLIREPVPPGFRPNERMLVRDENTTPVSTTTSHWCHIVRGLFSTADGLGTLESVITVAFDPMSFAHPHSHVDGCEEVWTALYGESVLFMGKQLRPQPPGTAFMIPPDGRTVHSNLNPSKTEQIKMLYFARYRDHEVRK